MSASTRLDNWVMESGSWEREEARDAMRDVTDAELAASCEHRFVSKGPWGFCAKCGEREWE